MNAKKTAERRRHLKQGERNLEKMLETLKPYLPEPREDAPPPRGKWRIADENPKVEPRTKSR